ncbi:MAG: insulinase family protein [Agarilytica sp.]
MNRTLFRYSAFLRVLVLLLFPLIANAATEVLTNDNDERKFEYLVLNNKLKVLLVSDPGAEKAAAALDVHVGSGEDPMEYFGLAHFLEHMLFLGTEKYPEPGEFQSFVDAHGGNHNAYTSLMHTNYFFDVEASFFEGALDRFAQFFIAPLFLRDYVERERQAVHSEFTSKYFQASRRERDVIRELAIPGHPISKFSTGNMDTLSQVSASKLRQELIAFYKKNYSANIMTLVISSPESLATMKALVVDRFNHIPNKNLELENTTQAIFPQAFLPAEVHIEPKKLSRKLTLSFPIPSTFGYEDHKPMHYIGNVLGHEGKGSLFSALKEVGWATALSAGTQFRSRDGDMFSVSVYLTQKGLENIALINKLVFFTIDQLKSEGLDQWRHEELRALGSTAFKFYERSKPINEVSGMANLLHRTAPKKIIWQSFKFDDYKPETLRHFLSYLREDNVLSTVVAPNVAVAPNVVDGGATAASATVTKELTDLASNSDSVRISDIYKVPYRVANDENSLVQKLPEAKVLELLQAQITLPEKNPFIAKKFDIIENKKESSENEVPELIVDKPYLEGWYLNDNLYDLPKTFINARLKLPLVGQSPEHFVATKIYVRLMKDALNNMSYNASLAGLSYSLRATARGIDLDFYGYSDAVDDLSKRVIKQLHKFNRSEKLRKLAIEHHFEEVRSELQRMHNNRKHNKVYSQIMSEVPAQLYSPFWTHAQVSAAFKALNEDGFGEIIESLFHSGRAQVFVFGNVKKSQAKREIKRVASLLKNRSKYTVPDGKVVKLERSNAFLQSLPVDSQDTAVVHYFQGDSDSVQERAKLRLLERLISTPFYNVLRTEQQLGYIVFTAHYPVRRVPGVLAVVQSPTYSAEDVHQRMRSYFSDHQENVFVDFDKHKLALINELSEKPKNQMDWADHYWRSIIEDDKTFEEVQQMLNNVEKLEREALEQAYREIFITHEPNLTFIASENLKVHEDLAKQEGAPLRSIENVEVFKAGLPSYRFP